MRSHILSLMAASRKPRTTAPAQQAPASAQRALGRATRQRSVLLKIIAREARPLSAYELHELAVRDLASISQSTVYRNLRALEDAGEVHAVPIPGQQPRYELADTASHHHHHFHCSGCDRVYDLEGCPGGLRALLPRGFTLEEHTILLAGKCNACVG